MSARHFKNYCPECWGKGSLYCDKCAFYHCEGCSLLLHDYAEGVEEVRGNKITKDLMRELKKEK